MAWVMKEEKDESNLWRNSYIRGNESGIRTDLEKGGTVQGSEEAREKYWFPMPW